MSNKEIIHQTLHQSFLVFRHLFKDNSKIKSKIDEVFEQEIEKELKIIPDAALEDIVKWIYSVKAVLSSIDYMKLYDKLNTAPFEVSTKFNVYNELRDKIKTTTVIDDVKIKSYLTSLISKCKPLLDCFTLILVKPLDYIKNIAEINDVSESDIFRM